jgi:alpha-N-acetylglucosaminidase
MQGWLFYSNSAFWTISRIQAYLGGVEDNSDMLILDLFSESAPQWQRTNSYFGKPWIWCQLHDYGGNMGLYGQVMNVTINPIEALSNSTSLVGFGLTMEGQEGNEIMYDLLLDQAWSGSPIDTETYFHNWVTRRYSGTGQVPQELYSAWDTMHSTVYNNTNLTTTAVTKSIFELSPSIIGMLNRTGHHATTINYDPATLVSVWNTMFAAAKSNPDLWNNAAYQYDMVDVTRQVMSNSFNSMYTDLLAAYSSPIRSNATIQAAGKNLTSLLMTLDSVLSTNPAFSLSTWISAARSLTANTTLANFYEYNARNQITLWGPTGQIDDYASKSWGGLVSQYYVPRWEIFVDYLMGTEVSAYNTTVLDRLLLQWGETWGNKTTGTTMGIQGSSGANLTTVLTQLHGEGYFGS